MVGIRKATGLRGCYGMVCIYKGFRYQSRRNGRNGKNSRDTKNGRLNDTFIRYVYHLMQNFTLRSVIKKLKKFVQKCNVYIFYHYSLLLYSIFIPYNDLYNEYILLLTNCTCRICIVRIVV